MKGRRSKIFVILFWLLVFFVGGYFVSAKSGFQPLSFLGKKNPSPTPKIDLKVDSECHYWQNGIDVGCFDFSGAPFGNWKERDLTIEKFFDFADLKPGDRGEETISLHVFNDDGCGEIAISNFKQSGNFCNEPEIESADRDCRSKKPSSKEKQGELWKKMTFSLWLDQGETPGFQGKGKDLKEGNNVFDGKDFLIEKDKRFIRFPRNISIRNNLRKVRFLNKDVCNAADPDGDGKTNYGVCHGLARDGRMVESATYYFGFSWELPESAGNEVQTDSLQFDLSFRVKSNSACSQCFSPCNVCEWSCSD